MVRLLRPIPFLTALGLALSGGAAGALEWFDPTGGGTLYPDSSDGRKAERPALQAYALGRAEIRVDGHLDDAAWGEAEAGKGFKVWDPNRGATPTEETVFKVAYSEDAIYFGVACLEHDPAKIAAHLARRDRFSNSDLVSIYLDPYHDLTTGYNFRVNPLGCQEDAYMYNDGDRDADWDAVWEAATHRDGQGWYAEIRIPFSAIRYRPASSMTWGLQVYRYMHGRGEDTAWTTWDRGTSGFVSRFGTLTGIEGIHAPRRLELLPYIVQRETDPAIPGAADEFDGFQNVGADLKYGITADLTLNATIQPDFGQVEADPAVLNLSPFETFFEEKRPFFIEGSRFFEHPGFNLFYSRRVGTGDDNARIRYAAKLTGKTLGGISVAALAASTDLTRDGQAHNLFKNGDRLSRYFVGRLGKEFSQGRHRVDVMQTVALNTGSRDTWGDRFSREAYTTGLDFAVSSKNRAYAVRGTFVGSVTNPEPSALDPTLSDDPRYGTGGEFSLEDRGGKWRGSVGGRWESATLELNDLGFLEAPDEINSWLWVQRQIHPGGKSRILNNGNLNLNAWRSWIYAGRTGLDVVTGAPAWSYEVRHPQYSGGNVNGWSQLTSFWEVSAGLALNGEGTHRYETRGGPLIREPVTWGGWAGITTDTRKTVVLSFEGNYFADEAKNRSNNFDLGATWNQSSALRHEVSLEFDDRQDDTQYLETVDLAARPGGVGIGGLSYVFGDIHQRTVDLTLRSSLLFSRTQSLEVYAQPFLTVGDYSRVRELSRPDSYDLIPYVEPGYEARDFDFSFAAVNLNVVYRWEYRPGSTFFLVWTHSRSDFDMRAFHPGAPDGFRNNLRVDPLFATEPENTVLAKITYWLPI